MAQASAFPDIGRGSETLKNASMEAVHLLGLTGGLGQGALELARFRIVDPRLATEVAGIPFESPLIVGAGEDKTGRCVDGFYLLGFAGVEVGTVTPLPQPGNPRPRLFYDRKHGTSLNRMGFNSEGMDAVAANLDRQRRLGIVGINVGQNKLTAPGDVPADYGAAAARLAHFGHYLVANPSTPNTPGARDAFRDDALLADIMDAVLEPARVVDIPVFIKTTVDLTLGELDNVLEMAIQKGMAGIIHSNTTVNPVEKARYGWTDQPGGLSGNNPQFRSQAIGQMRHITRQTAGTGFRRIGVGGIHNAATAIEWLEAGAEVTQVVTGIRQTWGLVARMVNKGVLAELDRRGLSHVSELVGSTVS
jgi:dihydroorotate dehydrogenase